MINGVILCTQQVTQESSPSKANLLRLLVLKNPNPLPQKNGPLRFLRWDLANLGGQIPAMKCFLCDFLARLPVQAQYYVFSYEAHIFQLIDVVCGVPRESGFESGFYLNCDCHRAVCRYFVPYECQLVLYQCSWSVNVTQDVLASALKKRFLTYGEQAIGMHSDP